MPNNKTSADVIIVGGGPAGMSAALWCCELGLNTILFERESEFGGQLLKIYNPITNYLGITAKNGKEMQQLFLRSIEGLNFTRHLGAEVAEIIPETKTVILDNGQSYSAKALILAMGVRRRKLGIPGEEEFQGRGIMESGAKEKHTVAGKTVLIVGGGDAAFENALILSEKAKKIYLVHRRSQFNARDEFVRAVTSHPKIEVITDTYVRQLAGKGRLNSAEIENLHTGESRILPIDNALIRVGIEPNTDLVRGKLGFDNRGYITVDANCQTTIPNVFAIGDLANPISPTIPTATGTATTAAKTIFALPFSPCREGVVAGGGDEVASVV